MSVLESVKILKSARRVRITPASGCSITGTVVSVFFTDAGPFPGSEYWTVNIRPGKTLRSKIHSFEITDNLSIKVV